MATATTGTRPDFQPLNASLLDQVVAIDGAHSGRPRRRFFEKRFAAAAASPDDFVQIGAVTDGALRGFAIARVLRGEFGREDAVAVLDALGVAPQSEDLGIGHALIDEVIAMLGRRGVRSLYSQASWLNDELLHFFATSGFSLAPRVILERAVAAPLVEEVEDV
ncbi:MAG: GNAT family N-acetyltransferase [Hyphomicrobiales bacterium]|nr:GNAT family N-acetyltransferase [Hyphomicrobiales bacterium]